MRFFFKEKLSSIAGELLFFVSLLFIFSFVMLVLMISVRVKNFLINLTIASVLAVSILAGLFYFKDKIINYFSKKSKMSFVGPKYKVKTPSGIREGFNGVVVEVDNEKVIIEKDGKRRTVFVDETTEVAVFDSEAISETLKKDKEERKVSAEPIVLQGKSIAEFIEERDVITIAEFREEDANYFVEKLLIFGEHKEMLFE